MMNYKIVDLGERTMEALNKKFSTEAERVATMIMLSELAVAADKLLKIKLAIVRTLSDLHNYKREDVEELISICLEEVAEKTGAELDRKEQKVDELIAQGLDPVDALAKAIAESGEK